MASPEKALCDLIANSPNVNLRYQKEAETYPEEDIRLDMNEFMKMNPDIFKQYIAVGKKGNQKMDKDPNKLGYSKEGSNY